MTVFGLTDGGDALAGRPAASQYLLDTEVRDLPVNTLALLLDMHG
jgi:hypothetical protein